MCPRPQNKLTLQFSSQGNGPFEHIVTTYEGDDTYSVVATSGGQPFEVDFLSRAATAEFLYRVLTAEHDISLVPRNGGFSLQHREDRSYEEIMRNLLLLRDSRYLVCG